MRSEVAERTREARQSREAKMSPEDRVRLALLLGERDLRAFASSRGLGLREAWLALRRAEQNGRAPSGAMDFDAP